MQTITSRRQQAEARRHELIEATIGSIAEYGIAGASIERISRAAGVSRGLIRHYFGSKRQLLVEAFQQLGDEFHEIVTVQGDGLDPEAELRQIMTRTFSAPLFSPERLHAWFGFWHAAKSTPELRLVNERIYAEERGRYRELLGAAAHARGITIDVERTGNALAALADGVWLELLVDPDGFGPADAITICNDFIDMVLGVRRQAHGEM
jgi:AcrR family transcriptional regulator